MSGLCPWIPGPVNMIRLNKLRLSLTILNYFRAIRIPGPVNMIRLNKLGLSLTILNYFRAINVAKDYGFCVKLSQDNNHMNI